MKSPMFKTRFGLQSNSKSKKTTINTAKPIRKVSVKVASGFICGIRFQDQNGDDLLNLDWLGSADWETQEIGENETIIGVYGRKSDPEYSSSIRSIGFIVRKL